MKAILRTARLSAEAFLISGCLPDGVCDSSIEQQVRGLKTVLVSESERSVLRVLHPSELTSIGFKVAGRLRAHDLDVGQAVKEGF